MGNKGVMVSIKERPYGTIENIHGYLLRSLKRGVERDEDRLTNQDVMPLRRAHVTVLNKAHGEEEIEKCLEEVKQVFEGMREEQGGYAQKKGRAIGFEV
jgi:hypothetical protein